MKKIKLMKGNNIELLKKLPDNSIDSIVSDPPYGLSFMNKKWDYDVPSVEFWKEVYRVLKPGGHILSFGGTRTYHRMVVNIEDAGFEIRDQIMWLYGSGFPKSHNIGKAVDKLQGNEREVDELKTELYKRDSDYVFSGDETTRKEYKITKGTSPYEGWGTALKPANEPICVARKPLSEKSVAENVLKWGTGGINIDGCRIEGAYGTGQNEVIEGKQSGVMYHNYDGDTKPATGHKNKIMVSNPEGRFPANIILDEIAGELLDEQSGISKPSKGRTGIKGGSPIHQSKLSVDVEGRWPADNGGGASRFFYVAKVSKKERNLGLDGFEEVEVRDFRHGSEVSKDNRYRIDKDGNPTSKIELMKSKNTHPTLKPINLMTYLCRLITPEGGIVLDPFMGSGSTGIAALLEGFRFVGMEMDEDYFKIAEARIEAYEEYREFIDKKRK
jgi:site-specific DNA-methyltransferase (adenine-specific)